MLADTVTTGVPLEKRFIQNLQQLFCCKHNNQTTSTGMSAVIGPQYCMATKQNLYLQQKVLLHAAVQLSDSYGSDSEQAVKAALDETTIVTSYI